MKTKRLLVLAAVAALLLGCSSDTEVVQPQEQILPDQSTPESTMQRFVALYESKMAAEYEKLFTGDFLFEFSNRSDPDLASEYSAGWWREDERMAALHLFQGGVNKQGELQIAAKSISLMLIQMVPQDDNSDGRDPQTHKVLFTPIYLTVELPPDAKDPEGTAFVAGAADPSVHRFFLVRGDAANDLADDQPADADHWYIWLWRDESAAAQWAVSPQSDSPDLPTQVEPVTWGNIKAVYR